VALDLLAMRPSRPDAKRVAVEFEPARGYIAQLRYDSVAFVSGFTSELDRLEMQVPAVLSDIHDALKAASSSWNHVCRLSVYLSRTQELETLKNLLRDANRVEFSKVEFEFVDGFARDKGLLEVEATALIPG
jgi:enamine deaminase RidA (YjgF/YER057c/UK114 family)